MKVSLKQITYISVITLLISIGTVAAQSRAYRVSDRQVQTLLTRIENRTNTFKNQVDRSLDNSNIDGTRREDNINEFVGNFENATNQLKDNFNGRRSTSADVQEVLNRAAFINSFMRNSRAAQTAQRTWTLIRTDLNTLAGYYNTTARWDDTVSAPVFQGGYTVSDSQMRSSLLRLLQRSTAFRTSFDRWARIRRNQSVEASTTSQSVIELNQAINALRLNFNNRNSNSVEAILQPAAEINRFISSNQTNNDVSNNWNLVRSDLDSLAGYYRTSARWDDSVSTPIYNGGYSVSDNQMRSALLRLQQRSTAFRTSFDRWARIRRNQSVEASTTSQSVIELNQAINDLRLNFNNRNSNSVAAVLQPSAEINRFISSNQTNNDVSNKWNLVRSDLSMLAGYYRMSWDWNNPVFPGEQYSNFDSRLTGTYRLNTALSDNVSTMVDRAITQANYNSNQRDRVRQNLSRRLVSPETLTFEKRGQQITMSASNAQSVILNADGVRQTETSPNGRTVTTSVIATNNDLTVNYEGDRMNDYFVSFMPLSNGQLRVTRRVYLENQNQTVTVMSVYDKTSQTAQWNTNEWNTNTNPNYPTSTTVNGFLIPNNTRIMATLDMPLSTKTARDGDRFSMTVTSPSQFNGAMIEGTVVGERSGVVSGTANMSLTFNTIRTRDGRVYSFAGIVDQVRNTNGDVVNVNNEGQIRDNSRTATTVTRAGIGAILGAIIGAVAGGGSGAAIGAGVGAGAGAGTVVLQGRDNLDLASGTQFSITSTGPSTISSR